MKDKIINFLSDKEIEYSYWDAESQCATDISEKDISMLQKKFSFE